MNRLLCLRMRLWPVQRRRAERPELRGVPLLIHRRDARRGERVVACCDLSRGVGVRPGMPLADTVDTLARLGIQTIDQLASLPRAGLAQRFGTPLLVRLDQAFGAAAEVLIPHRPPPRFEARQAFDFPTDRLDLLDLALGGLLD